MKSFRHWTPRYIKSRLREIYYRRTHPGFPWLTPESCKILSGFLNKSHVGLEFGSGRSTLWFAKRVKYLTSVEHNKAWYEKVRKALANNGQNNVDYYFIERAREDEEAGDSAYIKIIDRFETDSIDFILLDGLYRDICAEKVLRVIRPGGLLIIDNINWFLPSNSSSPRSRTIKQGPDGEIWRQVSRSIAEWRKIWTSSGVSDTALFFKPGK